MSKRKCKMNIIHYISSGMQDKYVLLLAALFISGPLALTAQQGTLDRDHNEQVTIVGTYDPTINQAFKINMKPEQSAMNYQKPEFSFQSLNVQQKTDIAPSKIKPARLATRRKIQVFENYLKAGFGSWITPYVDFYHSSGKKNDHRLNFQFNHISSFKDITDYSPSPFSNTKATVAYEKNVGKSIIDASVTYGLDTYRYYGFIPSDYPTQTIEDEELKQMFNFIEATVGAKSNNTKSENFEYKVNLGTFYYFDKWKSSQFNLDLDFDFARPFKIGNNGDNQKVGIKGEAVFGMNRDSVQNTNDLLFSGIPYYQAKFGIVRFLAGINFSYLRADSSVFRVYPDVKVDVVLLPEALTVYAGVNGGMVKNSYYNLTQVNPWVTSQVPITWQNTRVNVFAGVRGNIAKQLGYNFEVKWSSFETMPFFINISEDPIWGRPVPLNKFNIATDNGNVLTFSGELNYVLKQDLKLWLGGEFNSYRLDSLNHAYHKPLTSVNLGGSYLIKKRVNVWAEFITVGKRYAIDIFSPTPGEIDLDGFIDINVGVDVYITENFSAFANGTNLLNKNYERYYNYPVQGLQVMAGIGFRF